MRRFRLEDLLKVQTPIKHKRRKKTPLGPRVSRNMARARYKRVVNPEHGSEPVTFTPPESPQPPDSSVPGGPDSSAPPFSLSNCCVDVDNMVLVCKDGSAADGAQVTNVETINDEGLATISFIGPDGVERNTRLPICISEVPTPDGCCVDVDTLTIICTDTSNPLHGAQVGDLGQEVDEQGFVEVAYVDQNGMTGTARMPLCETPDSKCCYDAVNGILVCEDENDPKHGVSVSLSDIKGDYAYVCGLPSDDSSKNVCARFPLCPDEPPVGCCYDAVQGIIVCNDGMPPHGLVPEVVDTLENINDPAAPAKVLVVHPELNGGNRTVLPLCPEEPPLQCCYDAAKGTLRCPGSPEFDGLEVSLENMSQTNQGVIAVVTHPDLPGGRYTFPVCDDGVPDGCCYDGKRKVIVCPGDPELDGKTAGVVVEFTGPDGRPWVSVAWEGGGARMPLCTEECPPSFCCVNLDAGVFICPGEGQLHGQPANVVNVETDSYGFNFAVLADGTRVPVCGAKCPPPELCPECPSCPPGMWMTPDKECVDPPECEPPERCPPGMWTDPEGNCTQPPECEPPEGCPPGMWRDPEGVCRRPPKCPEHPPHECPRCPPGNRLPPRMPPQFSPGCKDQKCDACFCGNCADCDS